MSTGSGPGPGPSSGSGPGPGGPLPRLLLRPGVWSEPLALVLSDGFGAPEQPTAVEVRAGDEILEVRFHCTDRDAWGTHTERDAPLWEEEVVEVFLAPVPGSSGGFGSAPPRRYVEVEVSPLGTLFDAVVDNPTGDRSEMTVDTGWDLPGLRATVERTGRRDDWRAHLRLPWGGLLAPFDLPEEPAPPPLWRANFYRIDRPPGAGRAPGEQPEAEFSAWSPTFADPPDFHRPERFGAIRLAPIGRPSRRGQVAQDGP